MSHACCECTYITDAEGAVEVPTRPGHDSPEIGADGQGISGGHAPIPFATQAAARLNQVRPAGFLPCRNHLGARSA